MVKFVYILEMIDKINYLNKIDSWKDSYIKLTEGYIKKHKKIK